MITTNGLFLMGRTFSAQLNGTVSIDGLVEHDPLHSNIAITTSTGEGLDVQVFIVENQMLDCNFNDTPEPVVLPFLDSYVPSPPPFVEPPPRALWPTASQLITDDDAPF